MSELDNCNNCRRECNRECNRDNMGEGMVPFVVYGYPMRMRCMSDAIGRNGHGDEYDG